MPRSLLLVVVVFLSLLASPALAMQSSSSELSLEHPWVVTFSGCRGVLIARNWVLTAAHCRPYVTSGHATLTRIDWAANRNESLDVTFSTLAPPYGGWVEHPQYNPSTQANDLALVKLTTTVPLDRWTQTVALPRTPFAAGEQGVVATNSLTAGLFLTLRGPIELPASCAGRAGEFCVRAPTASYCQGDSGSALVSMVNGRATVRGVLSQAPAFAGCTSPNVRGTFVDVAPHTPWILSVLGLSADGLDGMSRVRASGTFVRGETTLTCTSPFLTASISGPMNVPGAQTAASCLSFGGTVTARCALDSSVSAFISQFTLRTTQNGVTTVTQLPFSSLGATATRTVSAGQVLEFDCRVEKLPVFEFATFN